MSLLQLGLCTGQIVERYDRSYFRARIGNPNALTKQLQETNEDVHV